MSIPASTARANLFKLIEQVNDDEEAVVITSNAGNAVLVSESEWESMLETHYLLSTPANRDWIMSSIEQADLGRVKPLNLPFLISHDLHRPKVAAKPTAKLVAKRVAQSSPKKSVKPRAKTVR
jgi:antitoxin YefM